ncbi:hypothetical protein PUN28_006833 [Cardiocondyla obscurior]|uniref:Uncharacterized protein n=1 Tax=Cardiocondyla obscurior TaxID=286306 RepID=A0AAW2G1X4_9HYME
MLRLFDKRWRVQRHSRHSLFSATKLTKVSKYVRVSFLYIFDTSKIKMLKKKPNYIAFVQFFNHKPYPGTIKATNASQIDSSTRDAFAKHLAFPNTLAVTIRKK